MSVCERCETVQFYRCSGVKLCCFACSDYHVDVVALNRWIVRYYDNNASVTEAAVVGHADTLIACSLYCVTCSYLCLMLLLRTVELLHICTTGKKAKIYPTN